MDLCLTELMNTRLTLTRVETDTKVQIDTEDDLQSEDENYDEIESPSSKYQPPIRS